MVSTDTVLQLSLVLSTSSYFITQSQPDSVAPPRESYDERAASPLPRDYAEDKYSTRPPPARYDDELRDDSYSAKRDDTYRNDRPALWVSFSSRLSGKLLGASLRSNTNACLHLIYILLLPYFVWLNIPPVKHPVDLLRLHLQSTRTQFSVSLVFPFALVSETSRMSLWDTVMWRKSLLFMTKG